MTNIFSYIKNWISSRTNNIVTRPSIKDQPLDKKFSAYRDYDTMTRPKLSKFEIIQPDTLKKPFQYKSIFAQLWERFLFNDLLSNINSYYVDKMVKKKRKHPIDFVEIDVNLNKEPNPNFVAELYVKVLIFRFVWDYIKSFFAKYNFKIFSYFTSKFKLLALKIFLILLTLFFVLFTGQSKVYTRGYFEPIDELEKIYQSKVFQQIYNEILLDCI